MHDVEDALASAFGKHLDYDMVREDALPTSEPGHPAREVPVGC
jgi:hypothetical protein